MIRHATNTNAVAMKLKKMKSYLILKLHNAPPVVSEIDVVIHIYKYMLIERNRNGNLYRFQNDNFQQ